MRCHSKNINGKALDELMMKKLEKIFVPTSEVYQELSKLTIKKDRIELDTKVEELNKKIKTNDEAIQPASDYVVCVSSRYRPDIRGGIYGY